jgi:hypothetical protein
MSLEQVSEKKEKKRLSYLKYKDRLIFLFLHRKRVNHE